MTYRRREKGREFSDPYHAILALNFSPNRF